MFIPRGRAIAMGLMGGQKGTVLPWYLAGGVLLENCLVAYKAIGSASLAASYINLANPGTNNAAPFGTPPTFNASYGWLFEGVLSISLTFGISTISTNTTIVRFSEVTGGAVFGTESAEFYAVFPNTSGNVYYYNKNEVAKAPGLATGVVAIAGTKGYRNGVEDISTLDGLITVPRPLNIGRLNSSNYFSGKIQAFCHYNITLTATQILAITNAMNALP